MTKQRPKVQRSSLGVEAMTLGVSGWRKIFAFSGRAEGLERTLVLEDERLVMLAAGVIGAYFAKGRARQQKILLARDTRPTGKKIVQVIGSVFDEERLPTIDMGIQALPQAMATVQRTSCLAGMVYITASHNPPGYNGIKLVDASGSVFSKEVMDPLIHAFKRACSLFSGKVETPMRSKGRQKNPDNPSFIKAAERYRSLLDEASFGMRRHRALLRKNLAKGKRYELLCDMNGSARLHAIDRAYLRDYGVRLCCMNDRPGQFVHRIVPEGFSLRGLKERMRSYRADLLFGYAVDADGDRGNLVVYAGENPKPLSAQATFYLTLVAELAYKRLFLRRQNHKHVVVTNEVTSCAVGDLCEVFGVEWFQAEVGEANVLSLAEELRRRGYEVLLMGEGSNGGCIIPPGTVRDPLMVVMSLLKLLFLEDDKKESLLSLVIRKLGSSGDELLCCPKNQVLEGLYRALNPYVTTAVFEPRALVLLPGIKMKDLQQRYVERFRSAFRACRGEWAKRYGFCHYKVFSYQGKRAYDLSQKTKKDLGSLPLTGGLKLIFYNASHKPRGFFWMRVSQTEPVCRLAVDVKGTKTHERVLLTWHKRLVLSCFSS